ncbi:YhcH/YjgK/YiaL family protein [Undibacterium sp. Di24W]|uniref:YhcH/YjgK/YiaL family protein n=1 Tax=Undibacterium sp. Di24W TaxID=3413033 RepID=UPI003BF354DF
MILGHLKHTHTALAANLEMALQHLRENDYLLREPGKYPIHGDQMFALVQDPITQAWETGFPEFHERHIDVQYLLSGEEALGYLPANQELVPHDDRLKERDIAFVAQQTHETRIVLTPGMYAIFFPGELHRPCRAVAQAMQIKKVVIKILAK